MTHECNENIRKALSMATDLMILADNGEMAMEDDGCGVLYGVVRDCAYKIRAEADREREAHKGKGIWDTPYAHQDCRNTKEKEL
jgi:hypothetical protein